MKTYINRCVLIIILLFSAQCAYYNTFFNTKKFFNEAEKERRENEKKEQGKRRNVSERDVQGTGVSSSLKQKYTKAIEKASRILEFYPKSKYVDDALLILGKSFFYREEYHKAKRKFEELINNFPQSEYVPEASLWLGKSNTELRDYATSEQNFQQILKGKSKQEIRDEAQFLLGGLHFHKGDFFTSLEEYKVAAENAKDKQLRSQSYFQMGECYTFSRNYEAAAESFEHARKYSQDVESEYWAQFKAGLAYKDLKKYDTAIKIFTELLGDMSNEDHWPDCKLEIADCLYLKGELDNAISWYVLIPDEHKSNKDAVGRANYFLGYIYQMHKSEYELAKDYYDKAVKSGAQGDIMTQAKARQKSVQDLLALRADIAEQVKRIAVGDSVAASMDSIVVAHGAAQQELQAEIEDTSHVTQSDTVSNSSIENPNNAFTSQFNEGKPDLFDGDTQNQNTDNQSMNFPQGDNQPNTVPNNQAREQKVVLKKGTLGTPLEELIKDKLMLAEIYLFDFNQPDSALFEYVDILERDTVVENVTKAIYSIGYIFENYKRDSLAADSVYRELIEGYPNTSYANEARKRLNIQTAEQSDAHVRKAYIDAEKEYIDRKNFDGAVADYDKIVDEFPESVYASKSLYVMGWIYEHNLNENEKALEVYRRLIAEYPESDFTKKVKRKVEAVDKQKEKKEQPAIADTTVLAADIPIANLPDDDREQEIVNDELAKIDKTSYRKLLQREMEKDHNRLRNPKRIIK